MKEFQYAEKTWGLPPIEGTSPLVQQGYSNTCAVRAQQLILQDFGINVSEDELVALAMEQGWFMDGTTLECTGNLLDYYGVDTTRSVNANIFTLTNELAQGHRVIVAVDSGELWEPGFKENIADLFLDSPDHAVIVAGVDTTDSDNITVQLMDPGTGEIAAAYPLEQFMDAWQDAGFFMAATSEPAPPFAFGMENFDYTTSLHLPFVGDMPYGEFERVIYYNDFSEANPELFEEEDYAWEEGLYHSFADGLLSCIKSEIKLPKMLLDVFGEEDMPSPEDAQLLDETQSEIAVLGNVDYIDNVEFHTSWADTYSDLRDMYESWGDKDTAEWYENQAQNELDDADYYMDQVDD